MTLAGKSGRVAVSFIPPLYISFTRTLEDPSSGLKPCEQQQRQAQAQHAYPGSRMHIPQCDEQGHFLPLQCHGMTGFCWCVDPDGHEVPGTRTAPGSLPPRCRPPGEKSGKRASSSLGHGSRSGMEVTGGQMITPAQTEQTPDPGPFSILWRLLPPGNPRMVCAHLRAHLCDRDGHRYIRDHPYGLRPHTCPGQAWK